MPDNAASAKDYADPFDPEWTLDRLSRAALARLCREYMVVSMYHDRALMPHIAMSAGQEATIRQADSEWMGSSPIYTERNKRNLGIVGDGVGEAFKGFQFDVGAPHHFLDFHFEVIDHDLGYFWLPFCGAHHYLRELTANDPQLVTNMCHHMEDRTFDATLAVTNPKLRAIPVHRPPKPDEFTGDHCRWEVRVVEDEPGPRPGEPSREVVFLVDDYVDYSVEAHDEVSGSIWFGECDGIGDDVCRSPLDWLDGFIHMAQAVNPRCVATRTGDRSWDLHIDPEAEPAEPHWLAEMCGGGDLRTFDLTERRVVIQRV